MARSNSIKSARQHGAGDGFRAGNEFIDAVLNTVATLHDGGERIIADELSGLGMIDLARFEEDDAVNLFGVDV